MQTPGDIERVTAHLLARKDLRLVSCRNIQSLWAGYGHICHVVAAPMSEKKPGISSPQTSFILKYITPPHADHHGSRPDEGHIRKLLSYQVELSFYTHLAPQLPPNVHVATCVTSINSCSTSRDAAISSSGGITKGSDVEFKTAMLLTDLRPSFPMGGEKRATLSETQVHGALAWLAGFHGFWWYRADSLDYETLVRPPLEHFDEHGDAFITNANAEDKGGARVWLNGGYTYLQTRRSEYASLCENGSEWSEALCQLVDDRKQETSVAELVARVLAPSGSGLYQTLIHGDVKSENLFTNELGDKVAFFDFQYVGLGLGVCDLAKLFTCSVPRTMLGSKSKQQQQRLRMEAAEERLLRVYLEQLRQMSGKEYDWVVFLRHWETALVDWLRFQASWGFWGNTEWLEGRVRSILTDREWMEWLHETI